MNEETRLKNSCIRLLKERKLLYFKLSDKFYSGLPDLLIIRNGSAIWVELKTPTGQLAKIQRWTINQLRENGCLVFVVITTAEFKEVLSGIFIYKN